jgi:murein L,D-transpeptidase YcbB/YkuD
MFVIQGRKTIITLLVFFLLPIIFTSCHGRRIKKSTFTNTTDAETFAEKLEKVLKPIDTANVGGKKLSPSEYMCYVYQVTDYQSVWMENNRPGKAANKFIDELEEVTNDGLNPEKYHLAAIKTLTGIVAGSKEANLDNAIALDTLLTTSYLAAAHDLLFGELNPIAADSSWHHKNDTFFDAPFALVHIEDKYVSLNNYRSAVPTYALLRDAYKLYNGLAANAAFKNAQEKVSGIRPGAHDTATLNTVNFIINAELPWAEVVHNDTVSDQAQKIQWYQAYMGVRNVTGKLDTATINRLAVQPLQMQQKLRANMERVRWMQKDMGNLYIIVDVPVMEFFLRRNGQNEMHMRTVVGKPQRPTPTLDATMANVVINPPWGVPPTILKQDVLPGITKSGAGYLAKKGLKVYDHKGNSITAGAVNSRNYKNYVYKQDPGDDNSLGYVKFNMPNKWDIYLHDTPHRGDFVKNFRALSSGCIRLQQPQQLALYILGQLEGKRYDQARLDSIIETHKTRWEIMKTKIPVHIVYLTNFEDTTGKHIRFINDVYGRDLPLISMLK